MTVKSDDSIASQTAADGRALLPCTPTQERFWFLTQFRPDDSSSAIAVLWEVKGAFQSAAFEEAFRVIIQRHEILRTRFVEVDGEPMQEVLDKANFSLSVIDLGMLPAGARRERANEICERESKLPFDLTNPPLLRVTAIRLDDSSALLLIVAHHAVFDGTSIGVLGRELGEIVSATRAKRAPVLPPLALQYGDYALWHREYIAKGGLEEDRRYWKEKLQDLPYFEVPADHKRPQQNFSRNGAVAGPLTAELGQRLEDAARKSGISLFAFGCAIQVATLHAFTGKSDIAIGTQVAGRNDVDLESLIGAFVNNVVLRFDASPGRRFSDFANDVAGTVLDALDHQYMPFDQVVRLLNPTRDMSRMPLYSINAILQPAFMEDADYGDFSILSAPSPTVGTLTDLNFILVKRPKGWRMTLEYNSDIFEQSTAQRLFDLWAAAIALAVSNPDALLSDFGKPAPQAAALASPAPVSAPALPVQATASIPESKPAPPAAGENDRTVVEQKLTAIWRTILRLPDVKTDANFFELGGHSFSAMRMLAKASEVLGVKVDPAVFFRVPTIAALMRYTAGSKASDEWRVVPIQPLGSLPPIIAINGATGYFNVYNSLSARLGPDQPVVSVQPYDPAQPCDLGHVSMHDMAADYVRLIGAVDATGPVVLVGHCNFGLIAFEVAQQLRQAGRDVLAVVMFDSWMPGYVHSLPGPQRFLVRWLSRILVHKNRFQRVLRREITLGEAITSYRFIRAFYPLLRSLGFKVGMRDGVADEDWYLAAATRARDVYVPQDYDGNVLLIVSDDCAKGWPFDAYLGWRRRVKGRIAAHRVGGYHMTMSYGGRSATIAEHIQSFLAARD